MLITKAHTVNFVITMKYSKVSFLKSVNLFSSKMPYNELLLVILVSTKKQQNERYSDSYPAYYTEQE